MPSRILKGHTTGLTELSQDHEYLYSGSKDRTLRIWRKDNLECAHVIEGFPCGCKGVSDGGPLYTITAHGLNNKWFAAWQRGSWAKLNEFSLASSSDLEAIVLDGQHVLVSARDGKVFVIDRVDLEVIRVLQQSEEGIWDLATDQENLYCASVDQVIRVWSKAQWKVIRELCGHRANIQALAVDDTRLYSIATDKTVIVWDKAGGAPVVTLKKLYRKGMLGLVSTDGHLLTLNKTQGLKVWKKGAWESPVAEFPELRSNKAVVDDRHAYFGLRDGTIAVYAREELGI